MTERVNIIHTLKTNYYLNVADEDEGVVVLNLLHGRLGGEGVLNDVVSIHTVPSWGGLPKKLTRLKKQMINDKLNTRQYLIK